MVKAQLAIIAGPGQTSAIAAAAAAILEKNFRTKLRISCINQTEETCVQSVLLLKCFHSSTRV